MLSRGAGRSGLKQLPSTWSCQIFISMGPPLDTSEARSWTATARLARRMVYLWMGGLTGGRGGLTEESVSPKSVREAKTLKIRS